MQLGTAVGGDQVGEQGEEQRPPAGDRHGPGAIADRLGEAHQEVEVDGDPADRVVIAEQARPGRPAAGHHHLLRAGQQAQQQAVHPGAPAALVAAVGAAACALERIQPPGDAGILQAVAQQGEILLIQAEAPAQRRCVARREHLLQARRAPRQLEDGEQGGDQRIDGSRLADDAHREADAIAAVLAQHRDQQRCVGLQIGDRDQHLIRTGGVRAGQRIDQRIAQHLGFAQRAVGAMHGEAAVERAAPDQWAAAGIPDLRLQLRQQRGVVRQGAWQDGIEVDGARPALAEIGEQHREIMRLARPGGQQGMTSGKSASHRGGLGIVVLALVVQRRPQALLRGGHQMQDAQGDPAMIPQRCQQPHQQRRQRARGDQPQRLRAAGGRRLPIRQRTGQGFQAARQRRQRAGALAQARPQERQPRDGGGLGHRLPRTPGRDPVRALELVAIQDAGQVHRQGMPSGAVEPGGRLAEAIALRAACQPCLVGQGGIDRPDQRFHSIRVGTAGRRHQAAAERADRTQIEAGGDAVLRAERQLGGQPAADHLPMHQQGVGRERIARLVARQILRQQIHRILEAGVGDDGAGHGVACR